MTPTIYFAAGFFSSTRMTSIGPVPMFSGRCAPAGLCRNGLIGMSLASGVVPETSIFLIALSKNLAMKTLGGG
jgi:hypothetical protein